MPSLTPSRPSDFIQGLAEASRPVSAQPSASSQNTRSLGKTLPAIGHAPSTHTGANAALPSFKLPLTLSSNAPYTRTPAGATGTPSNYSHLSSNVIYSTKAGGAALGRFIKETQACIRPRRREPPPEDHEYARVLLVSSSPPHVLDKTLHLPHTFPY